jgi:hypothetical protein
MEARMTDTKHQRRGPRAHRPTPAEAAATVEPDGYEVAYSYGLRRFRVILPEQENYYEQQMHWMPPGADRDAAVQWAHAHRLGIAHGLCSTPGPDPARVPKRVEGDDLDAVLKQIREDAQR